MRIFRFDELDFLFSTPAFDLLFAADGSADVVETLEINQTANVKMAGEAVESLALMFPYP